MEKNKQLELDKNELLIEGIDDSDEDIDTPKQLEQEQPQTQQDFLEISSGSLKIGSIRLDVGMCGSIALQLLKDYNVKKLLGLNPEKDKSNGSYIG